MSAINFGATVSLSEFANSVVTVGNKVTIIGEGEMGIGKSAMLKTIAKMLPTHNPAYIDCTLLDLGDFALPYTVEENGMKVTRFAPNARFKFHLGKPVIIMLDEIGKSMRSVKNVLLTLMLEHRIGDHYLPEGSIVFGTTNLGAEGVGDFLEPHARNRVVVVRIGKPTANEWMENFAIPAGLDGTVVTWVKQFPHCLASFDDESQKDNYYINHPGRTVGACVTPRTLEKASHIVAERAVLGEGPSLSLLKGAIGEAAARDMQAFIMVADKLPTWDSIIASPDTAKLPTDDVVAQCITVFSAVARVERDTLTPWMTYVNRMHKEWQALFAKSAMRSPTKQAFCVTNRAFKDWALANEFLF